jgi:hypothetical protein
MEKYINVICQEIELLKKLLIQNNDIFRELNNENINIEIIERKIINKDKLINSLKELDITLNNLWENWEYFEPKIDEPTKNNIKKLKGLTDENLKIEKIIIEKMENYMEIHKNKTLKVSLGKTALLAYKGKKPKISYFVNKKG